MNKPGNNKFNEFRKNYPVFTYEGFDYKCLNSKIEMSFQFNINNEFHFNPKLTYYFPKNINYENLPGEVLENAIFNIGMAEIISYWKATCSPKILIKPYLLSSSQISFWKKLFYKGLGEFFYTNNIEVSKDELVEFDFDSEAEIINTDNDIVLNDSYLIPVGGGKDSAVCLELLSKSLTGNTALVINQRGATRNVLNAAGYNKDSIIEVSRIIDPLLLELNDKGFLNGHTPFSALLAFVSSFASIVSNKKNIALSNESSANEASIAGTEINHQYSKSYEFENDFRNYYKCHVCASVNYFSFLRPLNEVQIAALFSGYGKYHKAFRSCNAGSKQDIWCCNCSKCLFTYIVLRPFIDQDEMMKIFGEGLLDKKELKAIFEQLCGFAKEKPFECVGTIDEINSAMMHIVSVSKGKLPFLAEYYNNVIAKNLKYDKNVINEFLYSFNNAHFLNEEQIELLKQGLKKIKDLIA